MQALPKTAACYGTKFFTTNPRGKIEGVEHIEFHEHDAFDAPNQIIGMAVERFKSRPAQVVIPQRKDWGVHGFSHEYVNYMLGGRFRESVYAAKRQHHKRADSRRCRRGRLHQPPHEAGLLARRAGKGIDQNNVLVVQTGCSQIALAKAGLMKPDAAVLAGEGLQEVCETVGIPPVLSLGSCVDNSRILIACAEMVRMGGLGDKLSDLRLRARLPNT